MQRREFLTTTIAATVPLVAGPLLAEGPPTEIPHRPLGRTGEKVSLLGLGGYHIGVQPDPQDSVRLVRAAIDGGITFMDNCWDYNRGQSEIRMGKALRDGYRAKVFLMTKIDGRTRDSAARQIDESLRRLGTDHVDLMQVHEVIRLEDPDRVFNDGAMEALTAAKQAGKIRFIGFTGHKDPLVHLRMLDTAAANGFRFDAVQMPLNVMDAHFRSFGRQVVPRLVKEEIGVLGMKSIGSGVLLRSGVVTAVECLRYAMSLPTSVVITGIDSMAVLKQDLDLLRNFRPMTGEERTALLARTAQAAAKGRFEPFKTSNRFDGTAANPQWLG
jgi:predicted aldo/keto reductase-like oxidoreductase